VQGFISRLRRVLQPDRTKGSTGSILETDRDGRWRPGLGDP
jgi:hypothetical protein